LITNDPSTWPGGDLVWNVCRAIALAEGANLAGSAPDRLNNPGDLSRGDEHGQPVIGYASLPDGEVAIQFGSKEAGWNALYIKIGNIAAGRSGAYSPDMTWRQIGAKYAGNSAAWVSNVTRILGVSPDARFGDYFTPVIDPGPGTILPPETSDSSPADGSAPADPPAPANNAVPTAVWVGLGLLLLLLIDRN
jgi:hypothetical protein